MAEVQDAPPGKGVYLVYNNPPPQEKLWGGGGLVMRGEKI